MGEKDARLIKIEAQSEGGTVSPEVWARDIGTAFPATIESATVGLTNLVGEEFTVLCKAFGSRLSDGPLSAEIMEIGNLPTQLFVECAIPGQEIKGILKLRSADKTIELAVKAV